MAIEPGETNLDGWLRPQGGSYPCPRAVGSLLVHKGHTLLGLPEAQTQVARVFVGLCALAPAPAPPLLLPGAGLRTPGLGAGGGGGLARGTVLCKAASVQCLLYRRKPSGTEGLPTPAQATPLGRVSQSKGEGIGANFAARLSSKGRLTPKALQPQPTPSSALPASPAPGMEVPAIPDGREGLGSTRPSENKPGLFSPYWTHSIPFSALGTALAQRPGEVTVAALVQGEQPTASCVTRSPWIWGHRGPEIQ